jgi:mannose-6-phosphate isomerase
MAMQKICSMQNTIQEYAWGSRTAIAGLLGLTSPSAKPQAELWMGTHPKAPSRVNVGDRWISLPDFIARFPSDILGTGVSDKFNRQLPYLFKVLAAARPLSIQAHPSQLQAQKGYERENRAGLPLTAANRNYKDSNHKPECICALTDFWALNGFRAVSEIVSLLEPICPSCLVQDHERLRCNPSQQSLKQFFNKMMTLDSPNRKEALVHGLSKAQGLVDENKAYRWMLQLAAEYPDDMGVFAPIWLNVVCLRPGEAMYLPAGVLHAYLEGLGIELMANSDNVLRGGLTPKHVDVTELLRVLNFEPTRIQKLTPDEIRPNEFEYASQADEFVLSVIRIREFSGYRSASRRSIEILLCTDGNSRVITPNAHENLTLEKGEVIMVPAALPFYRLEGSAVVYKASVPL